MKEKKSPYSKLVEAIYVSSDYSSNTTNCIVAIKDDLKYFLAPIAKSLKTCFPSLSKKLEAFYTNTTLASRLQHSIWPNGSRSSAQSILEDRLVPIERQLNRVKRSIIARKVARRIRKLYQNRYVKPPTELEQAKEYLTWIMSLEGEMGHKTRRALGYDEGMKKLLKSKHGRQRILNINPMDEVRRGTTVVTRSGWGGERVTTYC